MTMALDICPACGYPTIGATMCAACSLTPAATVDWPSLYDEAPAPAA
jgi:hypothetical protein